MHRKCLFSLLLIACSAVAMGGGISDDHVASLASNGIIPFIAVGELSLLAGHNAGYRAALQGAEALAATGLATEILKLTVREKRPESNSLTSFPSGHTSAAFAIATVFGEYHPRYQWLAYGAASLIGWSRVENHAHRWTDVAAGAALGTLVARRFAHNRITVSPSGLGYQLKW